MLAVSSTDVLNEASVTQLDYIVNKLGGNACLVDSRGNNAFHYLAANRIDTQAIEQMYPGSDEAKIQSKVLEQEQLRMRMSECLLRAKCNPSLENNDMETPLITAINTLNVKFARYLLGLTQDKIFLKKNMLAIMAEKCLELDACSIILGEKYDNNDILIKHK
jgi:hypothetical protein